ncbi:MAG TPA: MFS transporter [Chitinophagaceae bacterium]|nr:MFS transporter [Chitinophagaceae bacterium]
MNVSLSINTRAYRVAVGTFFFIAGLTFASWASRIPDIKNALHLNDAALGAVLFALPVGQMVSLPLSGWLISRFGSRQLVISAAILYPLTLVLLALTSSAWQLICGLFFFGLWANLVNIAMNTQAVGVEKLYGRSIMASFHGLWSLAGFTGAAIGSLFVTAGIPPLVHFAIICVLTAILSVPAYKYTLPNEYDVKSKQPLFVKPGKDILLLGLIAFCCMLCEGAMADWSGVYFQKVINTKTFVTIGYVAFTATMAGGRFVGDKLVTRFGVKSILQFSGIFIAGGLLTVVLFPYTVTATIGCFMIGAGVSCVVPMVFALAGRSSKTSPGIALAAVSSISFLGFLLGPPLIGFIAQASNLRWSFSVVALLGLGTTILSRRIKE